MAKRTGNLPRKTFGHANALAFPAGREEDFARAGGRLENCNPKIEGKHHGGHGRLRIWRFARQDFDREREAQTAYESELAATARILNLPSLLDFLG